MSSSILDQSLLNQDPYEILLNFSTPAGTNYVTFAQLDHWLYRSVQGAIIMGVRVGASIMTMFTLALVFKQKTKPLFICNQLTLMFILFRSVLYAYYYLGPSGSITYTFSGYYILTGLDRNITTLTNSMQIFIIASLEATMVIQVYAMFGAEKFKVIRYGIFGVAMVLGLTTVGFYINSVVYAASITYSMKSVSNTSWKINTPLILFLSSVCLNSFALICKLVMAIRTRRYLGLQQFSAYHAIFIMAFQTMIIPVAINLASYNSSAWKGNSIPELAIFITAIFLPLSTMWACSANNSPKPYSNAGIKFSDESTYSDFEDSYKPNDSTHVQEVISTNSKNFCIYDTSNNKRETKLSFNFVEKDLQESLNSYNATPTTARPDKEVWDLGSSTADSHDVLQSNDQFVAITTHKIAR